MSAVGLSAPSEIVRGGATVEVYDSLESSAFFSQKPNCDFNHALWGLAIRKLGK
jgi:hypothetical protein